MSIKKYIASYGLLITATLIAILLFHLCILGNYSILSAQSSACSQKKSGDADCIADGVGRQITIVDFQIWRNEFFNSCSSTNLTANACLTDDDLDGSLMDANFDYPGSGSTATDMTVSIADFEIWRKGYFNGSNAPTATPTTGGSTSTPTPTPPGTTSTPPPAGAGLWISKSEIAVLPASGTAWNNMKSAADASIGSSALYFQDSKHPQSTLAVALVAAKLGSSATCGTQNCREKAAAGIMDILDDGPTTGGGDGRVLALGRNLAAYVVAADLIDLKSFKPADDQRFRSFLKQIQTKGGHPGACDNLVECHNKRPNNWGTMAGASRIALDIYIADNADLQNAIAVFKGYIGDRASYSGFQFQSNASLYACSSSLTPLNPDCSRKTPNCSTTFNMSGAPIDDVQRDMDDGVGSCPPYTNYAWGGFSGVVAQAEMLRRAGYDSYSWQNEAIKRGMNYLQTVMPTSASGPTDWMPWVVNYHYRSNFNTVTPTGWGRLMAWTDWTHSK